MINVPFKMDWGTSLLGPLFLGMKSCKVKASSLQLLGAQGNHLFPVTSGCVYRQGSGAPAPVELAGFVCWEQCFVCVVLLCFALLIIRLL